MQSEIRALLLLFAVALAGCRAATSDDANANATSARPSSPASPSPAPSSQRASLASRTPITAGDTHTPTSRHPVPPAGPAPPPKFGSFDTRLAGSGFVPLSQGGTGGNLVAAADGRGLVLTSTCELARYDLATATLDTSFGQNGIVVLPLKGECGTLTREASGSLFARAEQSAPGEPWSPGLARLLETGEVDPSFDIRIGSGEAYAIDARDRVLLVSTDSTLRRFDSHGAVDATFAATQLPRSAQAMVALDSGAVVMGNDPACFGSGACDAPMIATFIGESGGIVSELTLDNSWPSDDVMGAYVSWLQRTPTGDVLVGVSADGQLPWEDIGVVERLIAPLSDADAWQSRVVMYGGSILAPSIVSDGRLVYSSMFEARDTPLSDALGLIGPHDESLASGLLGPEPAPDDPYSYYWLADGTFLPIGDGTALTVARKSNIPMLARVWIRP